MRVHPPIRVLIMWVTPTINIDKWFTMDKRFSMHVTIFQKQLIIFQPILCVGVVTFYHADTHPSS